MAGCLSALPKLESLIIVFGCPTPYPQRRNRASPPPTRFVLPTLTSLVYHGVSEYLEVLAARIDAPCVSIDSFVSLCLSPLGLDCLPHPAPLATQFANLFLLYSELVNCR
jgi:hypothetical protein